VDIPSYRVNPGERIQLRASAMRVPDVEDLSGGNPIVPGWLSRAEHGGTVLRRPERADTEPFLDPEALLQFYTR
jgi:ribosomal protein S4